ncbi:element excision factor XisI family protein [Roseofilum sp. SID3]|uniref:element excision factor XisI family protein n=1 Tax=unclassified Roseofilum TaxID=2620099 RepID=UPI0039A0C67A
MKDDKIWLQRNFTDVDLGEKLTAMGVKKEDIILGLHSPFMCQFSDHRMVSKARSTDPLNDTIMS